jgi:hypothetical protein
LIADTHHRKPATETDGRMFRDWLIYALWKICQEVSDSDSLEIIGSIEKTRSSLAKLAILGDSGSAPNPDAIDAGLQALKSGPSVTYQTIVHNGIPYIDNVRLACLKRRLFRTSNGFLGLGPELLRAGDEVVIAPGSDVSLILRPVASKPKTFQFVGQAYVHGIMHGEALELLFEADTSFEDIVFM